MDYRKYSDDEIVVELGKAITLSRETMTKIIALLRIIEDRRIFEKMGFKSLYAFARRFFKLDDSAANRYINAARLGRLEPSAIEALESGTLTLENANRAFSEIKKNKPSYLVRKRVVAALIGLTGKEAERKLQEFFPTSLTYTEEVRATADGAVEIRIVLSKQFVDKLERVKEYDAHRNPRKSTLRFIEMCIDAELSKHEKKRGIAPVRTRVAKSKDESRKLAMAAVAESEIAEQGMVVAERSVVERATVSERTFVAKVGSAFRTEADGGENSEGTRTKPRMDADRTFAKRIHIPVGMQRAVFRRANDRCQTPGCKSTYLLQMDHIIDVLFGGETSLENLQILCKDHHDLKSRARHSAFWDAYRG